MSPRLVKLSTKLDIARRDVIAELQRKFPIGTCWEVWTRDNQKTPAVMEVEDYCATPLRVRFKRERPDDRWGRWCPPYHKWVFVENIIKPATKEEA